jgi:hypothetical protein
VSTWPIVPLRFGLPLVVLASAIGQFSTRKDAQRVPQSAKRSQLLSRRRFKCMSVSFFLIWVWVNTYSIDTFLVGWTSIYQLFWGSLGTKVVTHPHLVFACFCIFSKVMRRRWRLCCRTGVLNFGPGCQAVAGKWGSWMGPHGIVSKDNPLVI